MTSVYSYGVYDMLHVGHVKSLEQAKELGDTLIVGVFSDRVASEFKRKPVIPQEQRLEMIKSLKIVDDAVIQDNFSPQNTINRLGVDIVAKAEGAGWFKSSIPQYDNCRSVLLNYTEGVSTSDIMEKIKNDYK